MHGFVRGIILIAFVCLWQSAQRQSASAEDAYQLKLPLGLKKMKIPKDNPLTQAKIDLGKQLYFDKRLSKDNTVSCASCHDPNKGWSNGERFATGVRGQVGGRSAPTIINSGYQYFQFWDGRAEQLEGQALGPVANPIEMDLNLDEMEKKLSAIPGYVEQFKKIFGTNIKRQGVAQAIAAFERTVLSGDAPYDRFKAGDKKALSAGAERGRDLFFNKGHCSACHSGPNFSDGSFHNIGVGMDAKKPDEGRKAHTGAKEDLGAFKTPTLRDIEKSAPYMHDGSIKTLEEVIEFYVKGGIKNDNLDEEVPDLKFNDQEKADLVTFLKEGLRSSKYPLIKPPELPK